MKEDLKKWIILILVAILSYWALNNITAIFNVIKYIISILSPFIIGIAVAFLLNIPVTKIENLLKSKTKIKKSKIRVISITLSLILLITIFAFIALLLIPELIENIKLLINNIPVLITKTKDFILNLLDKYPDIQVQIENMLNNSLNVSTIASNLLNGALNGSITFISSFISSFVSIFTGIIFAIYMLAQKENLIKNLKKMTYALLENKHAKKVLEIATLTNNTFNKFISGQCLEAVILASIVFVVSTICGFPYALIISVITGITALIPIFGAIIAMVIGAILIGITDPIQALIFIVVFLIIQQIEGNVIYPKVVGASIGLSPLWTLFAITVGGSLFGVLGMLIGLPLASVLYTLLKDRVNDKLNEKELKI